MFLVYAFCFVYRKVEHTVRNYGDSASNSKMNGETFVELMQLNAERCGLLHYTKPVYKQY